MVLPRGTPRWEGPWEGWHRDACGLIPKEGAQKAGRQEDALWVLETLPYSLSNAVGTWATNVSEVTPVDQGTPRMYGQLGLLSNLSDP